MKLCLYVLLCLLSLNTFSPAQQKTLSENISGASQEKKTASDVEELIKISEKFYPMEVVQEHLTSEYSKFNTIFDEYSDELLINVIESLEKDESIPLAKRKSLKSVIESKETELKTEITDKLKLWLINDIFPISDLFRKSLKKTYTEKLSSSEIAELNLFFKQPAGEKFALKLNTLSKATLKKEDSESARADLISEDFLKTPIGIKFIGLIEKDFPQTFSTEIDERTEYAIENLETAVTKIITVAISDLIINKESEKPTDTF